MRSSLVLLTIMLSLGACSAGNGNGLDPNGRPIGESPGSNTPSTPGSFKQLQDEIFTPLCIVCHAGAAAPVGLKLDAPNSYVSLVSVPSVEVPGLLRVAPNNPQQSYLLQKLTGDASVGARMPLGGAPVSDELIQAVRVWIENGALPDGPSTDQPVLPIVAATIPLEGELLITAPSTLAIVFNTPMDFSRFTSDTVALTFAGFDGVYDTMDDVAIQPITITPSNPQTALIDLSTASLDEGLYRLSIGMDDSITLLSLAGETLDGDNDGNSGGLFTLNFSIQSTAPVPQATWRWIQDNVFTPVCTQCHADGGIASFLRLDEANSFAALVNQNSNQTPTAILVAPNDADGSYLVQKIEGTAPAGSRMPLGLNPLDDATIGAIRQWIDSGAQLESNDPMPDLNAPSVVLLVPMSPVSGEIDLQVAASDDRAVTLVQLFVDDIEVDTLTEEPFVFVVDTTLLSDGEHLIFTRALDEAGNVGQSSTLPIIVDNAPAPDNQAPLVVLNTPMNPVSGLLSLSATVTDNATVVSVTLFIDNVLQAFVNSMPYEFSIDTITLPNGSYTIRVDAEDDSGNVGTSGDVIIEVDNPPPTDITNPEASIEPPAGPVSGSLQVTVVATDNVAVTSVELFIDSISQGSLNMTPYEFTLDTTQLSNGDHILSAVARDAAGNMGTSDDVVITVDNQPPPDLIPPSVSITAPSTSISGTTAISVNANDDTQVSSVSLHLDNVLVNTLSTPPYDFTIDVTNLPDGLHLLNASATDLAGNIGTAQPLVITVENGSPQATLAWIQQNVFSTSCAIGCHSDGGIASFLRLTDGDSFDELVNEPSTRGGPEFRVAPGDASNSSLMQRLDGDLSPSMPLGGGLLSELQRDAVRAWINAGAEEVAVDVIAPAVSLTLPPQPAVGTVTLSAAAVDDESVEQVQFFVDGNEIGLDTVAPYETTFDTTMLANGTYAIDATAQDSSGNVSQALTLMLSIDNP